MDQPRKSNKIISWREMEKDCNDVLAGVYRKEYKSEPPPEAADIIKAWLFGDSGDHPQIARELVAVMVK